MIRINDKAQNLLTATDIQFPLVISLPNYEIARVYDAETLSELISILTHAADIIAAQEV